MPPHMPRPVPAPHREGDEEEDPVRNPDDSPELPNRHKKQASPIAGNRGIRPQRTSSRCEAANPARREIVEVYRRLRRRLCLTGGARPYEEEGDGLEIRIRMAIYRSTRHFTGPISVIIVLDYTTLKRLDSTVLLRCLRA